MTINPRPLIILPLFGLAAVSSAQIVQDGSFEAATSNTGYTGAIGDGWTVTTGTGYVFGPGSGVFPHSGINAMDLDDGFALNTIEQTISLTVGNQYDFTFWLAADNTNTATATFDGVTLLNATVPTNGLGSASDYTEYSYLVTAQHASVNIDFSSSYTFAGGGIGIVLDDVSVTPAPEPLTILGLGAGIAGLITRRRLRAR